MSTSAATAGTVRSVTVLALACNLPVGIVAYAFGFLNSYMLNDMIGTDDHVEFILCGLAALALSTIVMTAILTKAGQLSTPRAVGISLAAGTILHAAFITLVVTLTS